MSQSARRPISATYADRTPLIGEAGTALIEAALSISVLLIFMFGVIQVSLALYSYHFISDAAREATRYAIVRGSSWPAPCDGGDGSGYASAGCVANPNDVKNYVQSIQFPGISSSNLQATPTWMTTFGGTSCSPCNNPGDVVQVQVTYTFPFSVPFLAKRTFSMSSTSEVMISY
jgi:Flp pilus assembly protein TadG